jgi:PAS domain S-box-containing protein
LGERRLDKAEVTGSSPVTPIRPWEGNVTDAPPERELLLADAYDAFQDAVYVKDRDGRYLMVNRAAAAMLGMAREQIVGKTDKDLFPSHGHAIRLVDQEVISSGERYTDEDALLVDGVLREYETTKAPLRDDTGTIFALIGISTDVTARRAAEQQLRQSQASLAEAQDVGRLGSWDWDVVRDALTWSDEMYRIFGVGRQDFEPSLKTSLAAMHSDDRDAAAAQIRTASRTETDFEIEFRVMRLDGEIRNVMARGRFFRDRSGEAIRMVGTAVDITERKQFDERAAGGSPPAF